MKMGQYRKMQICTFLLSVCIRLPKIGVGNEGGLRGHRQDLKPRSEFVRVRLSQQSVPLLCFYLVLSCQCAARASVLSKRIFVSVHVKVIHGIEVDTQSSSQVSMTDAILALISDVSLTRLISE